jgi:hypothetical protein
VNGRTGEIQTIRSLVHTFVPGSEPLLSKRNDENPIIAYSNRIFHVGEAVASYKGIGSMAVVKTDKSRIDRQIEMLLASVQPGDSPIHDIDLWFTLPDPYSECEGELLGDYLASKLTGSYDFTRNGVSIQLSVKQCFCVQEGLPAVLKARADRKIPSHGTTVCLDIGGGTANLVLVDECGDVVAYHSFAGMGGIRLASDILDNRLFKNRCVHENVRADEERIMGAIARGRSYLGQNPKVHWEDIIHPLTVNWYQGLLGDIDALLGDLSADVTGIIMTGGNANLFRSLVSDEVFIPDQPENYNIRALALYPQLKGVVS